MFNDFIKIKPRKMSRSEIMTEIKDFIFINFGLICYAIGWAAFLLPYKMTTGGLTGLCAIIYYLTDIPIQLSFCVINVVLLVLAFRELGYKFVLKTLYAIFMLSVFLDSTNSRTGPRLYGMCTWSHSLRFWYCHSIYQ